MRNTIAAVIAVLMTACSSSGPPVATSAASSLTPTLSIPAATSAAPTAATATPTVRPSPTAITELSQVFRPLATGWRPTGPTLVIARSSGSNDMTLVVVPVGPGGRTGAPVPLVTIALGAWSLRSDGGALAISIGTGGAARIAIWDVRSGAARWLTSHEPGRSDFSPLWSRDGASIYYASVGDDGKGTGLFQSGADGSGKKQIRAADERTGPPEGLTPDGNGLVWSRGQAGGSVEILDIVTGINRHLEDVASIVSWRSRQPRALLIVGGCCAGRPGGSLVAWDDIAMTSRVVAERGQFGDPAFGAGAWDPTGTRIAAVRFDNASPYEGSLVIVDPESGVMQPLVGTQGAGNVLWLPEGIVFSRPPRSRTEVMLLPVGGGSPVSVYQDADSIYRIEVVRP